MTNKNEIINDLVFKGILSVINRSTHHEWIGSMTNLNTALNKVLSRKQRSLLPGSPSALRVVLNRVIHRLRNQGLSVKFGRNSQHRYVNLSK